MRTGILMGGCAIALLSVGAAQGQTKPAAHNFAGSYQSNMGSIEITKAGPNKYKLAFEVMFENASGNFQTQNWDNAGAVRGNVLTIASSAIAKGACRMTYVASAKSSKYRISGCEPEINGLYKRS